MSYIRALAKETSLFQNQLRTELIESRTILLIKDAEARFPVKSLY